jgi:hypothetical protein
MSPPLIELRQICAYDGPNIFGPDPGVLLRARCDRDRSARLRAALKDGAQFVGLVIAYLEAEARPDGDGALVSATFATDAPAVGAELARFVVAGVAAEVAGDEGWDRDGPLLALRERHGREAVPVAALRLVAEARRRRLPAFVAGDTLRVGHGARGWALDLAPLREQGAAAPEPPWERLGNVPLVAVTGGSGRAQAVARLAADLEAIGPRVVALDAPGFEQARAALADPATEALVVGLDAAEILRRGVPFERCTLAAVTDRDGPRPVEAADDEEWLRALGVPMLLAEQPARLNLADPRLLPLVPYAPNGVISL